MNIDTAVRRRDGDFCEQGLIGTLLIKPTLVREAMAQVDPSDFANHRLGRIYATIGELWNQGVTPNAAAVADLLDRRKQLAGIGGYPALASLMAVAPSYDIDGYLPAILDGAARRRLMLASGTISALASDPDTPVPDALDQAKELIRSVSSPRSAPSEMVDVETFCAGEDHYDWLVPVLIERGDRILVVAAEKAGKSFLLRQLAVCAAAGIHPFRGNPVPERRVVILDFENPPPLVRRKLRPLWRKAKELRPLADPQSLGVLCKPSGIDVRRRSDASWLTSQLTDAKPDLVVVGPLYKMFDADDKWEQGARAVTAIFDDLRTRLGFALILETHAPQGMGTTRHLRPLGSSLWLRWPEFLLTFAPTDKDPNIVRLNVSLGRDERPWPLYMKRGGEWPWTACRDPEGPKGQDEPPPENVGPNFEQGEVF